MHGDDVTLRRRGKTFQILVGRRAIHNTRSREEAEKLLPWVRYRVQRGARVEDLKATVVAQTEHLSSSSNRPSIDIPSTLSGTVTALKKTLRSGAYDDVLDVLMATERANKNRKTAKKAIEIRMNKVR